MEEKRWPNVEAPEQGGNCAAVDYRLVIARTGQQLPDDRDCGIVSMRGVIGASFGSEAPDCGTRVWGCGNCDGQPGIDHGVYVSHGNDSFDGDGIVGTRCYVHRPSGYMERCAPGCLAKSNFWSRLRGILVEAS